MTDKLNNWTGNEFSQESQMKNSSLIDSKENLNNKNYCINCGKEIPLNRKYCNNNCQHEHIHKEAYKDFLENNDNYCRGNYTPKAFKKEFLSEQGGVCAICGCKPEWNGSSLVFVIDHIDGDASNNKRENLRMICPNCDSQLPTFKSKNKNSTRRNYWKEKIKEDILKDLKNPNNDT